MKTNVARKTEAVFTHEGARARKSSAVEELRRTVCANMLWEGQFYESGEDSAKRIQSLIKKVSFEEASEIALEAREKMHLRHVPLLITRELIRNYSGRKVGDLISAVIQRADEIAELVAMYWAEKNRAKLTSQMKIGLGRAFRKFSPYQLAKYDRAKANVRLRDVMFLCHAIPKDADEAVRYTRIERKSKYQYKLNEAEQLYQKIAKDLLESPDTWEVALSGGADKRETFERLIKEKKLGGLALIRNLRNMIQSGVNDTLVTKALGEMKTERILPFRFIAAARHAPRFEPQLEEAMFRSLAEVEKLPGKTAFLLDHSGSMSAQVSGKSEITRFDAGCGLAMILREKAEFCRVFAFSDHCTEVKPRRGFGLAEQLNDCMTSGGTRLGGAIAAVNRAFPDYDRLIVITDEQSHDQIGPPLARGYMINVASYKNGVAYGPWVAINGWSEAVFDFIRAYEAAD